MFIPKTYISIGKKELKNELFNPIENINFFIKPKGGLWSSPYYSYGISAWHIWCSNNMKERISDDAVLLNLKNNLKVCVIDSQEDLIAFIGLVGEQKNEFTNIINFWVIPDFEKAATIFDAILLTEKGERETRLPLRNHRYTLYGWDCESLLIMNYDCIDSWQYVNLQEGRR